MTENESIAPVEYPDIPDVEMEIAKDMLKRSWMLFLPAAILLGLVRGPEAAAAVILAGVLIVANLFIAAEICRVCARMSPGALMAGVMTGFVVRLAVIFGAALIVKQFTVIDFKVWLLSVAIGHIALLAWETRNISFSLSHPGVKLEK